MLVVALVKLSHTHTHIYTMHFAARARWREWGRWWGP